MRSYGILSYTQASHETNQGLKSIHIFKPQIYSYGQCPENKSVMSQQKKNHQISSYPCYCSLTSAGSSAAHSCSITLLRWGGGENWKSKRVWNHKDFLLDKAKATCASKAKQGTCLLLMLAGRCSAFNSDFQESKAHHS